MTEIVLQKTAASVRDEILASLAAELNVTADQLGSAARTIAYAFGVEAHELYYQLYAATKGFYLQTATKTALERRAADYGLAREEASKAVGFVTFAGTNGSTVPLGTRVAKPATTTTERVVFLTTQVKVVSGGVATAPVQADVAGEEGNVAAASVTEMVDSVAGVASVTNAAAMSLGSEEETDDALRSRIARTLEGLSRGTPAALRRGALEFRLSAMTLAGAITDAVTTIPVREDLNLVPIPTASSVWIGGVEVVSYTGLSLARDPDTGTFCALTGCTRGASSTTAQAHADRSAVKQYVPTGRGEKAVSVSLDEDPSLNHVDVIIDDGTPDGPHSALVALLEDYLRGDGTERNPGWRGAGTSLDVAARTVTVITVTVVLTAIAGYTASAAAANAKAAILALINALPVGGAVRGYAVAAAAQTAEGVSVVLSAVINGNTFNGSTAADVIIASTAVARATTLTVTVTA